MSAVRVTVHSIDESLITSFLVPLGESTIGSEIEQLKGVPNLSLAINHACLVVENESIFIEDLGAGESFLNSVPLRARRLYEVRPDETVRLGNLDLRFSREIADNQPTLQVDDDQSDVASTVQDESIVCESKQETLPYGNDASQPYAGLNMEISAQDSSPVVNDSENLPRFTQADLENSMRTNSAPKFSFGFFTKDQAPFDILASRRQTDIFSNISEQPQIRENNKFSEQPQIPENNNFSEAESCRSPEKSESIIAAEVPASKKRKLEISEKSRSPKNSVPPSPSKSISSEGRRNRVAKLKLFFTSGTESHVGRLGSLNFQVAKSWEGQVDGLVAGSIKRTVNFLCAISRGLPILDVYKLKSCDGPFDVEDRNLWLSDKEGEGRFGISLIDVIERARGKKILQGKQIFIFSKSAISMSISEIKFLVISMGGSVISRLPKDTENVFVIASESDEEILQKKGISEAYNQNFLLQTALTQKIDRCKQRP